MKAEINIDNKKRFIALYCPYGEHYTYSDNGHQSRVKIENIAINLKPLSSISDEDLAAIDFNFPYGKPSDFHIAFYVNDYESHWVATGNGTRKEGNLKLEHFDYLRYKSYALPWMGLTVDEMVEAGWIKLSAI